MLYTDSSEHIHISDDTLRRDLKQLCEEGKQKKAHGGILITIVS